MASTWFGRERYGLLVHLSIATVPAFAPRHEYADRYQALLADRPLGGTGAHPRAPLPEVRAWHREHHPGVASFDDFIAGLTLEHLDPTQIAGLAVDAGMGYLVAVARHHDGLCWWDSAIDDRTSMRLGPRRDVVAELAEAGRAHGLVLGLDHSGLDWSHEDLPGPESDPPTERPADRRSERHAQILELVERFRPGLLTGAVPEDLAVGADDAVLARCRQLLAEDGSELIVDQRWGTGDGTFTSFESELPAVAPGGPWQLARGVASSPGFNRIELDEDHLTAAEIVGLLTEVVARGGNLLLGIGPRADGTIPHLQAERLREAGTWVRVNADAIDGSEAFEVWGDAAIRYTVSPVSEGKSEVGIGATRRLNVIDLASTPELTLAHLSPHRHPVESVAGATDWHQDSAGLHLRLDADAAHPLAAVYRVDLRDPARRGAIPVRSAPVHGTVGIGERSFASIGAALRAARPDDVVDLGSGSFGPAETFPLEVTRGVTLRSTPGHPPADRAVIDGSGLAPGAPVVALIGDAAG
jgi:alpha-L-fucosidase